MPNDYDVYPIWLAGAGVTHGQKSGAVDTHGRRIHTRVQQLDEVIGVVRLSRLSAWRVYPRHYIGANDISVGFILSGEAALSTRVGLSYLKNRQVSVYPRVWGCRRLVVSPYETTTVYNNHLSELCPSCNLGLPLLQR